MLYVIDGLDGCGKETQSNLLHERLLKDEIDVEIVHFPVYESESSSLVRYIKAGNLQGGLDKASPYGISSAFSLDRFITFQNNPKLAEYAIADNKVLIADRYTTSNLIYQGIRFLGKAEQFMSFYKWCTNFEYKLLGIPEPSMVLILSLDKRVRDRLLYERYKGKPPYDVYENDKRVQDLASKSCYEMSKLGYWRYIECGTSDHSSIRDMQSINDELYRIIKMDMQGRGLYNE